MKAFIFILFVVGLLIACSGEVEEAFTKKEETPQEKPLSSYSPRVDMEGTYALVHLTNLRTALMDEANKNRDRFVMVPSCGVDDFHFIYETLPQIRKHFSLQDNNFEKLSRTTCRNGVCTSSSAPPDLSEKGWYDFLTELVRRLDQAGVDIYLTDKGEVDINKVVSYLSKENP